jgi:hypothetical protein
MLFYNYIYIYMYYNITCGCFNTTEQIRILQIKGFDTKFNDNAIT